MRTGYILFLIGLALVWANFKLPLPFGIIVGIIGLGAVGSGVYLLINAAKNSKNRN